MNCDICKYRKNCTLPKDEENECKAFQRDVQEFSGLEHNDDEFCM